MSKFFPRKLSNLRPLAEQTVATQAYHRGGVGAEPPAAG